MSDNFFEILGDYRRRLEDLERAAGGGGAGVGDVIGPASSPDNSLTRFSGLTGKLIQASSILVDDNGLLDNVDAIQFDLTPTTSTPAEGLLKWNSTDGTLDLGMSGGDITQQIGQELFIKVINKTGSTISNGSAVYFSGRQGNRAKIVLAKGNAEATSMVMGLTTQDILDNDEGYITTFGYVRQIKTNYSTWAEGDKLYVSTTTAGALTNVQPSAPNHSDSIGTVAIVGGAGIGAIFVDINRHLTMEEIADVDGTPINTTGQFLIWNETSKVWDATDNINNYLTKTQYADIGRFGFLNQTETTIAFDGTKIFTLGTAGSWSYYRSGLKYTITGAKTIDLTTLDATLVDGKIYFIYIDGTAGALVVSGSSWTLDDTKVPVATILWNNTLTPKYWLSDERHTVLIDRRQHYLEHFTEGAMISVRGALTLGGALNTDTNAAKVFAIATTTLLDEDIIHAEAALTLPNGTATAYTVFYRATASTWKWKASNMPFAYNIGNTNDAIQYDLNGTMTDAPDFGTGANTRWINSYLLVTCFEGDARYVIIPGQNVYTSLAAAQAESPSAFTFTGFPIQEAAFMYQLTWSTTTSTSQGKCRLVANPKPLSLSAVSAIGSGASLDHNSTSGLQGGTTAEYYHLTAAQYAALGAGGGDSITIAITQVAHGFVTGNAVYFNGTIWAKAKSDSVNTVGTHLVTKLTDDTFNLIQAGKMTVTSHGFTAGAWLFVSATTAGALTTTEAPISNPIAQAIDANTIQVHDLRATGGDSNYIGRVKGEIPSGTMNSSNKDFVAEFLPADGKFTVVHNRTTLSLTNDYTVSGKTVTLVTAPDAGDMLEFYYDVQVGDMVGSNSLVPWTIPTGAIDGVNKDFVLPSIPVTGTLEVSRVGQGLYETDDWTLSGTTLTMVSAPATGSVIRVKYQRTVTSAGNANTVDGKTVTDILALVYPVGSIYISVTATNPATLFGFGTWVAFATGRTLVGIDGSQTQFDSVEETGGYTTQTLVALIGAVNSNASLIGYQAQAAVAGQTYTYAIEGTGRTITGINHTTTVLKSDGAAPTTLQPYIVTYMFKRTA